MKVYIFLRDMEAQKEFYRAHFEKTREKGDLLICADGGYDLALSLGLKPHYLIGDLDSSSLFKKKGGMVKKNRESMEIISFPREKDFSDFELALKKAEELSPSMIFVYGATGGRVDHQTVNIVLLAYYGIPMVFVEEKIQIYNIPGELRMQGKKGKICTLLALGEGCVVKMMRGFLYTMEGEVLKPSSRGLSNEILEDEVKLMVEGKGVIFMVNS